MKLSVIIPIYNKEKYLEVLIEQLRGQTFNGFECLLIDDGSEDKSGDIADTCHEADDRFQVYHTENCGVSHARNIGLDHASGQYITFIDADDEVDLHYLENLVDCIEQSGVDLAISGVRKFEADRNSGKDVIHPFLSGMSSIDDMMRSFVEVQQSGGLYGMCVAKIMSSDLLDGIRFDESLNLAEDFDFFLRIYERVNTVFFDDHVYYYYRQSADHSSVLVQDDEIDYAAQLKIRLHYVFFLKKMGVYSGDQKKTVDREIEKYIYLALLYSPTTRTRSRFRSAYRLCKRNDYCFSGYGIKQRVVFYALNHKLYGAYKIFHNAYWIARKAKHAAGKVG